MVQLSKVGQHCVYVPCLFRLHRAIKLSTLGEQHCWCCLVHFNGIDPKKASLQHCCETSVLKGLVLGMVDGFSRNKELLMDMSSSRKTTKPRNQCFSRRYHEFMQQCAWDYGMGLHLVSTTTSDWQLCFCTSDTLHGMQWPARVTLAARHVDLVKTTGESSSWASEWWRKMVTERGMVVGARQSGLSVSQIADLLEFSHSCSRSLGDNTLLMPEVREEWTDWFEIIKSNI